jgi:ABC-type polysaccharide/polyol phosphate export permease
LRVVSIVNPMAAPVTSFRNLWLGTPTPDPMSWIFGLVFTAAVLLLGLSLFSHTQRLAADTI